MNFVERLKGINVNKDKLRGFVISTLRSALNNTTSEDDQYEVVMWLSQVRSILSDSSLSKVEAAKKITKEVDAKRSLTIVANSLKETFNNYKESNMPLGLKLGLPVAGIVTLVLGPAGAGIVALGGGIGLPVALLAFLGVTGVGTVLEAFIKDKNIRPEIVSLLAVIATNEVVRRTEKAFQEAMVKRPATPERADLSENDQQLKSELQSMDPIKFERHIMSFFEELGWKAGVTKASNDFGLDGWAIDPENGLIIVQCKRNADKNKIGRPVVQQFWGVLEQQKAYKGYIVTTSTFTDEAKKTALENGAIELVDLDILLRWHEDSKKNGSDN